MKKKFNFLVVALLTVAMLISVMPSNTKAEAFPFSESEVKESTTCHVNGTDRTHYLLTGYRMYYQISNETPFGVYFDLDDGGMDHYSSILIIQFPKLLAWNYDLCGRNLDFRVVDYDVTGLEFDYDGFVIGYKKASGEVLPVLTFEELSLLYASSPSVSSNPLTTDKPSENPTATSKPPANPTATSKPSAKPKATSKPSESKKPVANSSSKKDNKLYVKKNSLYKGKRLLSKHSLKKGVLIYIRTGKKALKYKSVKSAWYIEKSQNLLYTTKKGALYRVSRKSGKKKCLMKKGVKKVISENGFAVEVKRKKGKSLNVENM